MTDAPTPLQPDFAGGYTIERELGRGGMATVFLARDLKHHRPVALKALHPHLSQILGPERFQREIELLAAPGAVAQSSTDRASLQWSLPTTLPPGALAAVVSGDPNSPGQSTFLLSMPNGYRVPPHYHPSYEHLEVRKGTLLLGMGDELDPKRTRALAAGHSATAPAGMHHFWIARGGTEVSVTFDGPYTITYLRREDAPRRQVFPFGY